MQTSIPAGSYLVDPREIEFLLFEQLQIQKEFFGKKPFSPKLDQKLALELLSQAYRFAQKLGEAYQSADQEECRLRADGHVEIPSKFFSLWAEYISQWGVDPLRKKLGKADGERIEPLMPNVLSQVILEMFMGANPSFMTYGGFTIPAAKLIAANGTEEQKDIFLDNLISNKWDACFCATEKDAGSDITAVRTRAVGHQDQVYSIQGEKIYISAGMHSLTSNTIYFVLGQSRTARSDGYHLSCYLVPRFWWDSSAQQWINNNVECVKVEEKMGLKGCANTHLVFGRKGETKAFALGNKQNVGLLQLIPLMSEARVGTALFGVGIASSAYLHSVRFARQRVQGRLIREAFNTQNERVPIIAHGDVQRMLLDMKSRVEGCRLLVSMLCMEASRVQMMQAGPEVDRERLARSKRLVATLTPIVKAYVSDEAWRICETAIQVHGGIGYLKDLPIEQYARDVKILSIWEGTNYIQAQDLLRDKLGYGLNSLSMKYLNEDFKEFIQSKDCFPRFHTLFERVQLAWRMTEDVVLWIGKLVKEGQLTESTQFFTRCLFVIGTTCVAWKLLEAACTAQKGYENAESSEDMSFYEGKVKSAEYFIFNLLPSVECYHGVILDSKHSIFEIDSNQFNQTNRKFGA
jgi:acyl-CoA dehydrogenase